MPLSHLCGIFVTKVELFLISCHNRVIMPSDAKKKLQESKGRHYSATIKVGKQGRVVIPAKLRELAGVRVDDELVARWDGGRIVLESRGQILQRLRNQWKQLAGNADPVEELFRMREEDVILEQAKWARIAEDIGE